MQPPQNTPLMLRKKKNIFPFSLPDFQTCEYSITQSCLPGGDTHWAKSKVSLGSEIPPRSQREPAAPSQRSPLFPHPRHRSVFPLEHAKPEKGEEEYGPLCELNTGHVLR